MEPRAPSDAEARALIQEALDESLLVEAAAGTGKTTELIKRLVAVIRSGRTTVDRIVAVTFTKKAAGELKLRLREELDRARAESTTPAEQAALESALARLEEARIGTIHGFCADLLRERPVEAGIDPSFEELAEADQARIFGPLFRRWFEEQLLDLPPGLARALARQQNSFDPNPIDRLAEAALRLLEWRDFPAPWRREAFEREPQIESLLSELAELAALSRRGPNPRDPLRRSLEKAVDLADLVARTREAGAARDVDLLEGALVKLLADLRREAQDGSGPRFASDLSRREVLVARDRFLDRLEEFRRRSDADLAALLRAELGEALERYEALKRSIGRLDFTDLLLSVRALLVRDEVVRRHLQQRFSHIFVDEFQDTDPLQAEILILLAADDPRVSRWQEARPLPGKLFLVGDPKQSIYRFRRADMALYASVKRHLAQAGVRLLHLKRSFRAVRPIQELVNAAFEPLMRAEDAAAGVQAEYVPLEEHAPAPIGQPAVIVLPVPRPYGRDEVTKQSIEESLPSAVAAWIEWLVKDSGYTVRDRDSGERRVVQQEHVLILFRRFLAMGSDITRRYTAALEARGLDHVLVGARSFHQREEVETMRAALTAVEWPDDELAVYATLRGSLWAISDGALFRWKEQLGHLDPLRSVGGPLEADLIPIAEGLASLRHLHRSRNRQPIVQTVNAILAETRAHAGFLLRPAGNQVLANVQKVCDLARAYELGGGISFRGFVQELAAQAEDQRSTDAPVLEEGADGVRLMTVHTAKGLEAPVVILADIGSPLSRDHPDRHLDPARGLAAIRLFNCAPLELLEQQTEEARRDRAESVRLAYVAATRARDLLVIPAVGEGPQPDSWTAPLNAVIFPPPATRRQALPAVGCPAFGDASVVADPPRGTRQDTVQPGLHRASPDSPAVVWWDPNLLRLEVSARFGLRQSELLAEPPIELGVDPGAAALAEFQSARRIALQVGARPSLTLITPTEAEAGPSAEALAAIQIELTEAASAAGARPRGKRFGGLVHAILRDIRFDAAAPDLTRLAEVQGRLHGADRTEIAAALEAVHAALRHPRVIAAGRAAELHREAPITLAMEDRRVLEGTLDLAFREGDGSWTVIDFKTDPAPGIEARTQLAWYVRALAELTGATARGVLLVV